MSATAYLQLTMTSLAAVRKMCERHGYSLVLRNARHRVVTDDEQARFVQLNWGGGRPSPFQYLTLDLTGKAPVSYDSDRRDELFRRLLGHAPTREDLAGPPGKLDAQIAEALHGQYEAAAAISTAETEGWAWEEVKTQEGYTQIEMELPTIQEASYERSYE